MYFDNQKMRNFENSIIESLRNEGIEAESVEIVKNGIPCKGVRICNMDGTVSPIIYYSEHETVESIMSRIRDVLSTDTTSFGVERLTDWNYVKDHAYLSVQKSGTEDIVKKPYLNLEIVLRIYLDLGDETGSVKVTPGLVAQLGIAEDELWRSASANSHAGAGIRSMSEILGLPDDDQPLYIATTGQMTGGASVLYFPEVFRSFCEDHGEEACYMLPSSTEEILVLQETALDNVLLTVDDLVHMVETINRDQVDPILRLEPAVYRYSVDTDEIDVVATL